jgi:hypothetical protein
VAEKLNRYHDVEAFFEDREEQKHLIYFYAHGGKTGGLATLNVADERLLDFI